MRGFMEFTNSLGGNRAMIAVSELEAVTENHLGKAVIILKDHDEALTAVETYDEIRSRLDACMREGNT